MRKFLAWFGAAIMAMALASPAMAQAPTTPFPNMNVQAPIVTPFSEFKTWGHIEIQTIWEKKPDFNTGRTWSQAINYPWATNMPLSATGSAQGQDVTWKHVAERFRFHFQYGDPKTVRAVLGFEADSQDWGEPPGGGTAGNAASTPGSFGNYNGRSNHFGVYASDQVQLEITWAFLEFAIPNTPVQLVAGMQRFMVGGRMWMQNDAPGLKIRSRFAPHLVELFWWRQNDRSRNQYQPNDYYGAIYQLDQKIFNVYAWGAYNNDLYNVDPVTGASPPVNVVLPGNGTFGAGRYITSNHPYWLAFGGGFRPGNWDFSGQFIYNSGKMSMNTGTDYTYRSMALEIAGKYRIGPGMFMGLEYFYASGNDADSRDKINSYVYPAYSESNAIFGNDRTVFFWRNGAQLGYYHERNLPFSGMWYGRANFEYSPFSWVRFNLNYLYIEDNAKGTPGPGKTVNSPMGSRQDKDARKVGQEFNLITTFNIHKGLQYHVGLAMFLPGEIYNVAPGPGIQGKNAETAYAVNSKLVYAF